MSHRDDGLYAHHADAADYGHDTEKYSTENGNFEHVRIRGLETSAETSLHRGLKARHISMIAIGGALGTGLIIGTGKALAQAGPGSLLISYCFVGILVYGVMASLGEMASWLPMSAGFTGYATRYCHPSLGFALGWTYWFKYIITTPNQLTAAALVIQYWCPREKVNPGVFIAIFLVTILVVNYLGIELFGELEFWLSSFKVIIIVGIIIFSLCIACGGGPNHDAPGFRYWNNPGAFAELYATGSLGKFLGFWSVMVNATFAYLGTELVGVTAGEAQNPRRSIPKAIKLTFFRILFFYCLSVFLVGMIVPYNSEELTFANKQKTSASASPFVVAAVVAGVEVLPHIINACILVFVFSASNSDLYIASRTLYGLASDEAAPAIFKRTDKRGVPYPALFVCAAIACLAFMNASTSSTVVFGYFVNLVTIFGILTWISILVTYLFFLRARRAQNIPDSTMPYVAPQGYWGTVVCLFFVILISLTKNFDVFIRTADRDFDYKNFITGYLGIPLYIILLFGHMLVTGSRGVKAHEVDFYTGKDIIDAQEAEYLEKEEAKNANSEGMRKFYNRYVAWLF
ncbi:dicarboxylic amino acid permease [Trichoderma arundinaceum]|uniref:Dicarboxylic amino acid permease n=1 Tax=Trichoderma arundinaceum TaxID=490622 RepID=A0A395NYU2_TRIAR|nr:dicarboxylic amino acid permease [Trichoderma arundinaceum]